MPPKKKPAIDDDLSDPSGTTLLLSLINRLTDMIERNFSLSEEVSQLRKEQQLAAERQDQLLKRIEDLENSKSNWGHSTGNRPDIDCVQDIVGSVSDELAARKDKELNVVIYGLKEDPSNSDNPEEATKASVANLLENGLNCGVPSQEISRAFRLGRPRPVGEKPRPIKVFIKNQTSRSKILEKCRSLSILPQGHAYRHVFIKPDRTKLQRDSDFKQRQKLKQNQTRASPHQHALSTTRRPVNCLPVAHIGSHPTSSLHDSVITLPHQADHSVDYHSPVRE